MKRELSHAWRAALTGLCVALPFFLSASLAAQWQPLTPEPKLTYQVTDYPWAGVGSGPFQEVIAADLDGDLILDAVARKNGVAMVAWSPTVMQCFSPLVNASFVIRDLDRLPGAGGQGQDGVLVLTTAGLQQVVVTNGTATVTTLSAQPEWQVATKMRVVDLGAGQFMVVGVAPDAHTCHSVIKSGTSWVDWKVFTTVNAVREILVGNWDGDGMPEVLVETTSALEPFGWRGLPRPSIASIGSSLGIAVLPSTSGGYCEVAWIEQTASGKLLTLVDRLGRHASHALVFPVTGGSPVDFDFVGVAAGDVDMDGDADVVITQKTSLIAIVLYNNPQGAGAVFGPFPQGGYALLYHVTPPTYTPVPGNNCPASVADWDRDGRADVLTARDDAPSLNLHHGIGSAPNSTPPQAGLKSEDILWPYSDFDPDTSLGKIHLVMSIPQEYRDNYTHVQCVVWKQNQPGDQLSRDAVLNKVYLIYHGVSEVPVIQWLTLENGSTGTFPPGTVWAPPNRKHFYVQFRFVTMQTTTQVATASPTFAFGMTIQDEEDSTTFDDYLENLPHHGGKVDLSEGTGPWATSEPPGGASGRVVVGSIVIQRVLPPSVPETPSQSTTQSGSAMQEVEHYWGF